MLFWAIKLWMVAHAAFANAEHVSRTWGERGLVWTAQAETFLTPQAVTRLADDGDIAPETLTMAFSAPDDAPTLPSRLYYAPDGWMDWGGWRYHEFGLVCPPQLGAFTRSRSSPSTAREGGVYCDYYGPDLQILQLGCVDDSDLATQDFLQAYLPRGYRLDTAMGNDRELASLTDTGGARASLISVSETQTHSIIVRVETSPTSHADLVKDAVIAIQRAQAALDKRDRLSASAR